MISIGIIGAPGSGKTELARELQFSDELLAREFQFSDGLPLNPIEVIDQYVEDVELASGWAAGPWASYMMNYMIVCERAKRELGCQTSKTDYITCGTVLESSVYMAMRGVAMGKDDPYEMSRSLHSMSTLGMILNDTFWYNVLFYLPLEDGQGDPLIEKYLILALEEFGVSPDRLPIEGRLASALSIINERVDLETTSSEQPTV